VSVGQRGEQTEVESRERIERIPQPPERGRGRAELLTESPEYGADSWRLGRGDFKQMLKAVVLR